MVGRWLRNWSLFLTVASGQLVLAAENDDVSGIAVSVDDLDMSNMETYKKSNLGSKLKDKIKGKKSGELADKLKDKFKEKKNNKKDKKKDEPKEGDSCTYYERVREHACFLPVKKAYVTVRKYHNRHRLERYAYQRSMSRCERGEDFRAYDREQVVFENMWQDPRGGRHYPYCLFKDTDPDGDGWGWENEKSCKVPEEPAKTVWVDPENGNEFMFCQLSTSNAGDGWGYENDEFCKVPTQDDMKEIITIPGVDVHQWCSERIECRLESHSERKRGVIRNGRCRPR